MKARILELLENPENIVNEDLQLLNEEIAVQPYAQSLRALYLFGIKKFDSAQFQKTLSTTAAYTTDKKVLYQFINGEKYEPKISKIKDNSPAQDIEKFVPKNEIATVEEAIIKEDILEEGNWLAEIPKKEIPKKIIVEGQINRILFEGEENFLNEESETKIDLEATAESGVLVTEKTADSSNEIGQPIMLIEKSPEKFRNDLLSIKSEKLQEKNEIMGDLKPQISEKTAENRSVKKIEEKQNTSISTVERSRENKYEIARKKLAEEIERKMSQSKNTVKKTFADEIEDENNADVDFFQTQDFSINSNAPESAKYTVEDFKEEKITAEERVKADKTSDDKEDTKVENSTWQPMISSESTSSRFKKEDKSALPENYSKDNLIKENSTKLSKKDLIEENLEEKQMPAQETSDIEISLASTEIPSAKNEEIKLEKSENLIQNEKSNVPVFINTWQNWLKIDRSEEKTEQTIQVSKDKNKLEAIEKFIDNAPKISKFKEDNNYAIPEKKDDISHLMTETLANLFRTQKLYSKAINAYKILITKHPEKTEYYKGKIEEIQISRQK